jgi:hypothetical protein
MRTRTDIERHFGYLRGWPVSSHFDPEIQCLVVTAHEPHYFELGNQMCGGWNPLCAICGVPEDEHSIPVKDKR